MVPQALLNLPSVRASGTAIQTQVPSGMAVWAINANVDGGHFLMPFVLPPDVDVSREVQFFQHFLTFVTSTDPGTSILFRTQVTWKNAWVAQQQNSMDYDFFVPDPWVANTWERFKIDAQFEPQFPGGTFAPGAVVGLRCSRIGTSAIDNYPLSVSIIAFMEVLYYKRCQKVCC